jgi:hypothetical protein
MKRSVGTESSVVQSLDSLFITFPLILLKINHKVAPELFDGILPKSLSVLDWLGVAIGRSIKHQGQGRAGQSRDECTKTVAVARMRC